MAGFTAHINVPGYSPEDDGEPARFDTAQEAWAYLASERAAHEDEQHESGDDEDYSATYGTLAELGEPEHWTGTTLEIGAWLGQHGILSNGFGTVYGPRPGYDGQHDQGLAYSVVHDV